MPLALEGIPPFPAVAIQVLRTASNEYARLHQLSELIRADAGLTAGILRSANSSLYGLHMRVDGILQAILLLGFEKVKAIVVTAAMRSYLGDSIQCPCVRACWRHNLACALTSQELASGGAVAGIDEDVAYTAGLIHDIGRLALAVAASSGRYGDFLANSTGTCEELMQREREIFGVDHCEAGAALATAWDLPQHLVNVIALHHDAAPSEKFDLVTLVHFACRLADVLGFEALRQSPSAAYADLRGAVPDGVRRRLPEDPAELGLRIAAAINSIETS